MSFSVRPENVLFFEIENTCMKGFPCGHSCTITLSEGRKESILGLDGDKIYVLINSIAEYKIDGDISHFEKYKNIEEYWINYSHSKSHTYTSPIPEEILTRIFQEKLALNSAYDNRDT